MSEEFYKITSGKHIHKLGQVMPIAGMPMRIIKSVEYWDHTDYFLEPAWLPELNWKGRMKRRWARLKLWARNL